jgi:hypothetical protein
VTDKNNTRIRFGFVPYAMTVNAQNLLTSGAMPSNYFVDSSPYITKLVQFSTTGTTVNGQTRYLATGYRAHLVDRQCFGLQGLWLGAPGHRHHALHRQERIERYLRHGQAVNQQSLLRPASTSLSYSPRRVRGLAGVA